jgi:hypothetical protein
MKHIVDTPSEVTFLKALEKHLKTKENFFTEFDWWMFSKVDHTLDKQIRIPYIDPANGKRDFLPDFVFWLQKGKNYHILYIDPKGTGRSEYQFKVDGYRDLFEDSDKVKTFKFSGKNFKFEIVFEKEFFAEIEIDGDEKSGYSVHLVKTLDNGDIFELDGELKPFDSGRDIDYEFEPDYISDEDYYGENWELIEDYILDKLTDKLYKGKKG